MSILTGEEIIEIAVRLEEKGEAFYIAAAKNAANPDVQFLFQDLADQERLHRRAFERMSGGILEQALTSQQWDEFQAYAGALLQQRVTDKPDGSLKRAEQAVAGNEALEAAIGFERETLEFYIQLRDVVRAREQHAVDAIIQEEHDHVARLSALLATMT
jgi:rubrerythrin